MNRFCIATLSLCAALLVLSQPDSDSQSRHALLQLDIEPSAMTSSATFYNFVCCGCYERGPGSRSTSYFCSYKAVTTHIGRSFVCRTEGKGVQTVTMQYRPSGRAEDQEAGPVGAAGAWPVRSAAPAGAGKSISYAAMWHRTSYSDILVSRRYRIIPMYISYNTDIAIQIVCDIFKNV